MDKLFPVSSQWLPLPQTFKRTSGEDPLPAQDRTRDLGLNQSAHLIPLATMISSEMGMWLP